MFSCFSRIINLNMFSHSSYVPITQIYLNINIWIVMEFDVGKLSLSSIGHIAGTTQTWNKLNENCIESILQGVTHYNDRLNCIESILQGVTHYNDRLNCIESILQGVTHYNDRLNCIESILQGVTHYNDRLNSSLIIRYVTFSRNTGVVLSNKGAVVSY